MRLLLRIYSPLRRFSLSQHHLHKDMSLRQKLDWMERPTKWFFFLFPFSPQDIAQRTSKIFKYKWEKFELKWVNRLCSRWGEFKILLESACEAKEFYVNDEREVLKLKGFEGIFTRNSSLRCFYSAGDVP